MLRRFRRRLTMRAEHRRATHYLREHSAAGRTAWTYSEYQEALRATTSPEDRVTPLDPLGLMKWDGKDVEREAARARERDEQRSAALGALGAKQSVEAAASAAGVSVPLVQRWKREAGL